MKQRLRSDSQLRLDHLDPYVLDSPYRKLLKKCLNTRTTHLLQHHNLPWFRSRTNLSHLEENSIDPVEDIKQEETIPEIMVPPSESSSASPPTTNTDTSEDINTIRQEQSKAFDKTTAARGKEGGLFRACMKEIRSGHVESNKLRMGIVVAGMFTDRNMYRDIICSFYVVTAAAERRMDELIQAHKDPICLKLCDYGFRRSDKYEQDLQVLFQNATNWKEQVEQVALSNAATRHYVEKIQKMQSGVDIAGALFVLWGGLVIGGGAVARNRILKLCGPDAVNLYDNVHTGCPEERAALKEQFYLLWDSLASFTATDGNSNSEFQKIVQACGECMKCNNQILGTYEKNPWWLSTKSRILITATLVAISATVMYQFLSASTTTTNNRKFVSV